MTDGQKSSGKDNAEDSRPKGGQFLPPPEMPEVLRAGPRPVEKPRSKPIGAALADIARPLAIGIDFLATIGAAGLIGWGLDRWLGWTPYGIVVGITLGFVAGTVRLIQRLGRDDPPRK